MNGLNRPVHGLKRALNGPKRNVNGFKRLSYEFSETWKIYITKYASKSLLSPFTVFLGLFTVLLSPFTAPLTGSRTV